MDKFQYLIIGGGVAGTTAAETIRLNDKEGAIAIVSSEPHVFYSRVMLSKPSFLLEKIPANSVYLKNREWYDKNKIVFLEGVSVINLSPEAKTVALDTGTVLGFDKLLLAVGVQAREWKIKGAEKKGVCYLRTLDHAKQIADLIKTSKRAIVVGSSCISFEILEDLLFAGIEVTEVMREKYFWEPMLDENGGKIIEKAIHAAGIKILRETEVSEVLGDENVEGVLLTDGTKLKCEMIVAGIGVVYPLGWVKDAVRVGKGIIVNEFLETNVPNIWSAGDVAEFDDMVLKETQIAGNWMNAREQGRIAGLNMVGKREPLRLVSSYLSHAFGTKVAFGGDIRMLPGRKSISRSNPKAEAYTRIIINGNTIIGVAAINSISDIAPIIKMIKSGIDISGKEKQLADPDFNLAELL